jgi:glycosidase
VSVAGSFNNWNANHDPLHLDSDGKTWTAKISLAYGRIQYKFVVNGKDWVVDPNARSIADGSGHTNSELLVAPADYATPASPTDGITATSALMHVPSEPQLNWDRGHLEVKFRARLNDLERVDLVVNGKPNAMTPRATDDLYQYYLGEVPWDGHAGLAYYFELHDGAKTAVYDRSGYEASRTTPFQVSAETLRPFKVPDWPSKTVLYQIFPDRFANGDPNNDPKNVEPWSAKPTYSNRFGGDAAGVQQHLGYLKELGVGAVYFTPLFTSPSNHRYDTTDYLKIDPEFGTNQEFKTLTEAMKADGIRTVMDFAFFHTSPSFFAFDDVRKNGAASKYVNWYFFKSFPVRVERNPNYEAYSNYAGMPHLNVLNAETERYMLDVVEYWRTHASLDGARLDDANEVNPKLWRDLRTEVKAKDPNFWILGEDWGDANPWLGGDQWDSTMGYQFRAACLDLFADNKIKPSEFLKRLIAVYDSYPSQVSRNLMNLIGTHDTPRFLTLCHGNKDLLKLAATVQLTWPGAPCVYYGDEVGMEGGVDPDNRRGMDWDATKGDNPVLRTYRRLIATRNHSVALQEGDPAILSSDDTQGTFSFARSYGSDAAVVVVNDSDQSRTVTVTLPVDSAFKKLREGGVDTLSGTKYGSEKTLTVNLAPMSAQVIVPASDVP